MIVIVNYENSTSKEIAESLSKLTGDYLISDNEIDICRAEKIIFSGKGDAATALKKLHLLNLFTVLRIIKKPMLGIGLGMQLMADYSMEGNVSCLGIFPGTAVRFENGNLKSVNEGLHPVKMNKESLLFNGIDEESKFYFNHSFFLPVSELTTSSSTNKTEFSSSVEKNSSFAVQFHPEKSSKAGLQLLKNFIEL
ncbi:MAG TPA: imidazole glycerol phosphate synthase subunit HisH [Ignavibacteriaceae bacterium]